MKTKRGFTLIELLVVVSIIAILATIGLVMYSTASKSGRIGKRVADLKAIADALQIYYNLNGNQYPTTGGSWRSECPSWGGLAADQVIPNLVPNYMVAFPADPSMDKVNNRSCYLYQSNGTDYKLLDHSIAEFTAADYLNQRNFVDPARDGGGNCGIVDGTGPWAWAVWSSVNTTTAPQCW